VNAICRESAGAAQLSGPGARVHLALDERLPMVTTDAERLRSALVNMLVNARHAVAAHEETVAANAGTTGPGLPTLAGGTLSGPSEPPIVLRTERRGDRIAIVIEDRGVGIDPADLARMFDPYFTTKRGGTGLGLAITKNIIDGLQGTIAVTSAPGAGTTIQIDLPADAARMTDR
jgi:signal transduction histidine kinase